MILRPPLSVHVSAGVLVLALWPAMVQAHGWRDLWLTPDQQAQRLFDAGDYAAAAARFSDPLRIGVAWYLSLIHI